MNKHMIVFAGMAAVLLAGAAPASAQMYYDGPGAYAGSGPFMAPGPYDDMVPYAGSVPRGHYYAHQETYVGLYGRAHRRCRAHTACYQGPRY